MNNYLLTVQMRIPLRDDAEARENADDGLLGVACNAVRKVYDDEDAGITVTAKLQRLYDDRPPRLLDRWPSDDHDRPMPAAERALRERHAAAGHEGVTSSWAEGGK